MTTTTFNILTDEQLATMQPGEIDAVCADLATEYHRTATRLANVVDRLHTAAGERPIYIGRGKSRKTWTTDLADTIAKLRREVDAEGYTEFEFGRRTPRKDLDNYGTHNAQALYLAAAMQACDNEYNRRPWSRFFLVRANGGHIHSSQSCQTCNRNGARTDMAWQPELSGLTEADAVKALGPILCTVCYPSAPLAWTAGLPKPAHCPGSHQQPVAGTVQRYARSAYGQCPSCSDRPLVTMGGTLRKHAAKSE